MHSFQQGNEYFIFSFDRTFNDKSNFFKPKFWQTQERIIGTAKGRGTTYFLQTEDYLGVDIIIAVDYGENSTKIVIISPLSRKPVVLLSFIYYNTYMKQGSRFLNLLLHEFKRENLGSAIKRIF